MIYWFSRLVLVVGAVFVGWGSNWQIGLGLGLMFWILFEWL